MADTKISGFPAATAATGGSIPISQSGNTKKLTMTPAGALVAEAASAAAQRMAIGAGTAATLASDVDGTLAANSDANVATQKAVKTYVDAQTITVDTDTTLAANSDARVASQKAIKAYVASAVTGLLNFKGSTDCSGNPNYPAAVKGDAYVVSVAGKIGGASGKTVAIGDVYFATADNAGGTQAGVGASWDVLEHQLVLAAIAVSGSASDLGTGTIPLARIVDLTDTQVAAANKDGAAGTASLRTLGSAAGKAAPGNRQFEVTIFVPGPLVGNIVLSANFPRPATIVSATGKTASGSVTQDINIGGTIVTGLGSKTYDSTGETDTATALKTLAAGNVLNCDITAVSSPVGYSLTLLLAEAD